MPKKENSESRLKAGERIPDEIKVKRLSDLSNYLLGREVIVEQEHNLICDIENASLNSQLLEFFNNHRVEISQLLRDLSKNSHKAIITIREVKAHNYVLIGKIYDMLTKAGARLT